MSTAKNIVSSAQVVPPAAGFNREWWEANPMTYDWEKTLRINTGSLEWYQEIDRRFLQSAFYARDENGEHFGRFLKPDRIRGKQVLEIGCGMGTHAELLVRQGACLTAIDQTTFAVRSTQRRLRLKGLEAQVCQEDAESLSFRDQSFDMVWTWGVIHHSRSTEKCVGQLARVLHPGGSLVMMVYYRPSLVYYVHCGLIRGILMGQLLRRSLDQIYVESTDGFYARAFTKPELRSLLSNQFHSLQMTVVGLKAELYPIPRSRLKTGLENATPDCLAHAILGRFGSMIVVQAIRS